MIYVIISAIAAYLFSSINSAIIITKIKTKNDIRTMGSSNAGMTNVLRSVGKSAAIGTAVFDVLKGSISVIAGYLIVSTFSTVDPQYGVYAGIVFSVLGHCYPIYHGFRGGKGVLTLSGAVLVCEPIIVLILGALFVVMLLTTKTISICSITVSLGYSVCLTILKMITGASLLPGVPCAVFVGLLVTFRHRSNIKRLISGEEGHVSVKK